MANLPYVIATPILSNLLMLDRPPDAMTCTIQKEVAQRIVAGPGSKDYGALAVWVQCQCRAEIVRLLPPSVFWPRPKVSSAFIQITLDPQRRQRIADRVFFHRFVRAIFSQRRKLLRGGLLRAAEGLTRPDADRLLAGLGLPATVRAEELDPGRSWPWPTRCGRRRFDPAAATGYDNRKPLIIGNVAGTRRAGESFRVVAGLRPSQTADRRSPDPWRPSVPAAAGSGDPRRTWDG